MPIFVDPAMTWKQMLNTKEGREFSWRLRNVFSRGGVSNWLEKPNEHLRYQMPMDLVYLGTPEAWKQLNYALDKYVET